MKKLLLMATLLFSGVVLSQTVSTSWVDPCTGEIKVVSVQQPTSVPSSGNPTGNIFNSGSTVVTIYNQSRVVTSQDIVSGELTAWIASAYQAQQAIAPCSEKQATTQTTAQAVQQTAQEAATQAARVASNPPTPPTPPTQETSAPNVPVNTSTNENNQTTTPPANTESSNQNSTDSGSTSGSGSSETDGSSGSGGSENSSGSDTENTGQDQGTEDQSSQDTESSTEESSTESESTEDSTSDESNSEEGESETSEGEAEDESSEESSEDKQEEEEVKEEEKEEKKEEKKKKKKQKNTNPPIIVANVSSIQNIDGSFQQAMTMGWSKSSLRGDKNYSLTGMVWSNMKQFMLMGTYSKMFFKEGRPYMVYSFGLGASRMYTTSLAMNNHNLVFLGKKGSVFGITAGATTIFLDYQVLEGKTIYYSNALLSGTITSFFSKPYTFDRWGISPMVAVSSPFITYGLYDKTTTRSKDLMVITGGNFDYTLTKNFKVNLGINLINNTNKDIRSTLNLTIGSRFSF